MRGLYLSATVVPSKNVERGGQRSNVDDKSKNVLNRPANMEHMDENMGGGMKRVRFGNSTVMAYRPFVYTPRKIHTATYRKQQHSAAKRKLGEYTRWRKQKRDHKHGVISDKVLAQGTTPGQVYGVALPNAPPLPEYLEGGMGK